MKIRKILIWLFLVIGIVGCSNSEEKAIQYLEERYGKEFEVMSVKGDLYTVHQKDQPEVIFTIRKSDEGYVETYLQAKWSNELQQKLRTDIENELPLGSPFKVVVSNTRMSVNSSQDKPVEEVLKESETVIVSIITAIKTDGEPDVSRYSQGIYSLYNLLKDLGVNKYSISVGFVDQSEDLTDYIKTAYVNNIGWSNLQAKVYGVIGIDDRYNPENPSDLIDEKFIIKDADSITRNYNPF